MDLTRDAGWYWSEVHIPGLAVPLKEAARVNECPLVADNRSPDYNPAENLKMIIGSIRVIFVDE